MFQCDWLKFNWKWLDFVYNVVQFQYNFQHHFNYRNIVQYEDAITIDFICILQFGILFNSARL